MESGWTPSRVGLSRSVERVIAERDEGDIVVGIEPRVWRARSGGDARERGQLHVFILQPGSDPSVIPLVEVLPEANRELLRFLDVECAGQAGDRRVEAPERAAGEVLGEAAIVDEIRVAPAALRG